MLRRPLSPSGGECPVRHALDEREQSVSLERKREIREHQSLEGWWKEGGRAVVGAIEEHRTAARHRRGNGVGLRQRDPRLDEYGEWRAERRQLSPFLQCVDHVRRVARAGEQLRQSFQERAVGANE